MATGRALCLCGAHTCNHTWEAEAREPGIQGQSELQEALSQSSPYSSSLNSPPQCHEWGTQRTAWRLMKSQQSVPCGNITHVVVQRPAPTQACLEKRPGQGLAWAQGPVRAGNSALSRKMGGSWRGHCGCTGVAFIPRQLRQEGSTHQLAPEEASTGRVKEFAKTN